MTPTPQAQVTEEMRNLILDCVPSNWVDNLLTGKDAPKLPWNCQQINQLLKGIRKRLESALESAQPAREDVDELIVAMVIAFLSAERHKQDAPEKYALYFAPQFISEAHRVIKALSRVIDPA